MSHKVTVKPNKSVRLPTAGKYCDRDIIVTGDGSEIRSKTYYVTIPTAVAAVETTVVSGDPDVAAHYTDADAMATVRKITNNSSNGINFIMQGNRKVTTTCGIYGNFNGTANNAAVISSSLSNLAFTETSAGTPYIKCTAAGDIIVYCLRSQNNFGGADYIITFSW